MHAYVKLINSGKFTTVGINQIKNYKPNRPSKVFEVKIKGEYHKCLIGLTNESKEGLADQINKGGRVRFPPAALLSDLSEIDEKTCCKEKKSVVEDNTRDILNKKLSAINKCFEIWKSKEEKKHHDNKKDELIVRMSEIERRIEDLKKELELQRKMFQKILDFWNKHKDTPSNHGSIELEKKTGHPRVGFTRVSDNSIHLGQGVYVSKNSYLTAASRSETPSQFVRKMIMAVFSPKELQDSSVHGAKSNKVKQKIQKEGLDPVRLQAVKDIFSYYLKESAQFDKDKHEAQMKQFYNNVSSKITDTRAEKKRPNEKKLPKVKPVESSDTEDISDIEEDTIASNGEEDSEESTDEVSDQEFDNAMIQEREEEVEKTDVDHEAEPTVAIVNTIEEKSIEETKEKSEPNNSFNPNNSEEKVTD